MAATPPAQSQDRDPGEAFREALAIGDEMTMAVELGRLGPDLSDDEIIQAYEVVSSIVSSQVRPVGLGGIGPYLSGPLTEDALSEATSLPDEHHRAYVLASIADRLPDERVGEAWKMARACMQEKRKLA